MMERCWNWVATRWESLIKRFDVNLRYAVALKVINAQFIGDESARRRFVRDARAAASVRHPNVASVFHLGKSGDSYFYAMEFVDGESLDKVIRRSSRLDPSTALKVTALVAAGLEAIDKQNLVHRDIKPSNIMVSLRGDNIANAKIIDLGLAKGTVEDDAISAISIAIDRWSHAVATQALRSLLESPGEARLASGAVDQELF
jgi:serine/threonine protein kinase